MILMDSAGDRDGDGDIENHHQVILLMMCWYKAGGADADRVDLDVNVDGDLVNIDVDVHVHARVDGHVDLDVDVDSADDADVGEVGFLRYISTYTYSQVLSDQAIILCTTQHLKTKRRKEWGEGIWGSQGTLRPRMVYVEYMILHNVCVS